MYPKLLEVFGTEENVRQRIQNILCEHTFIPGLVECNLYDDMEQCIIDALVDTGMNKEDVMNTAAHFVVLNPVTMEEIVKERIGHPYLSPRCIGIIMIYLSRIGYAMERGLILGTEELTNPVQIFDFDIIHECRHVQQADYGLRVLSYDQYCAFIKKTYENSFVVNAFENDANWYAWRNVIGGNDNTFNSTHILLPTLFDEVSMNLYGVPFVQLREVIK